MKPYKNRPHHIDFPREVWEEFLRLAGDYPIVVADMICTSHPRIPFDALTGPCPYCGRRHIHRAAHGFWAAPCGRGRYFLAVVDLPYPENDGWPGPSMPWGYPQSSPAGSQQASPA